MIKQKKGSAWIWILVFLILIAAGIGIFLLLSSGSDGGIFGGGNLVPQPPALPE